MIPSSATGSSPTSSRLPATPSANDGSGGCVGPAAVVDHHQEGSPYLAQDPRPGRPRRPGPAELHRRAPRRRVAHRHHRAPHPRGQALPLRHQGLLQQPDRRLQHRGADDCLPGRLGAPLRDRPSATGGHRGRSQRPRRSVPRPVLPSRAHRGGAHRLNGPSRRRGRQRRDGILLLAAPEKTS